MTNQIPRLSPQDMDRLSRLSYALAHNDKTRPLFARLVAQVDPQSAKAFGDVAVDAKLAAFKKALDAERMQEKMSAVAAGKERQKQDIIKKRNLNPDQVKELEKIQEQYGFSDWTAAADIYAQRNPPDNPALVPPPEIRTASWEFPTVPGADGKMLSFSDYIKDPRKHSNETAYQMITDFKRGKLPAAFHA